MTGLLYLLVLSWTLLNLEFCISQSLLLSQSLSDDLVCLVQTVKFPAISITVTISTISIVWAYLYLELSWASSWFQFLEGCVPGQPPPCINVSITTAWLTSLLTYISQVVMTITLMICFARGTTFLWLWWFSTITTWMIIWEITASIALVLMFLLHHYTVKHFVNAKKNPTAICAFLLVI